VHQGMEKLGIKYATPEGEAAGAMIMAKPADGNVDAAEFPAVLDALDKMYTDAGINESIERAAEYQLNDSTRYFWDRASIILSAEYLPDEQDVLRARVRTTGIVQQNFAIGESKYTMFDVGGQRNERRKWIHCFDNVTAVIFVTAISEYDQVLYEDENTNRMDEALILFDQILNHPSFAKTSMILFLNKRDLFEKKLAKKDMSCWEPEAAEAGHDYDKAITYIKKRFMSKNKEPEKRQVYIHATCATDTSNISFVMESVFDIILKENLRKMDATDVDKMVDTGSSTGASGIKFPPTYASNTVVLCASFFVDTLKDRSVLVADAGDRLPAVEVAQATKIKQEDKDWLWIMGLGKDCPSLPTSKGELGSFQGNFKDAARKLREVMGLSATGSIGSVYDLPIVQETNGNIVTWIVCFMSMPEVTPFTGVGCKLSWKVFEDFENAQLAKFAGVDTNAEPCKPPPKGEEFNPFAANPVGKRWFKGITLYSEQVNKKIDKGVYVGVFKVLSAVDGFMVMVNEHNRIMIPMIFLTENQLGPDDLKWMQGVRVRWNRKITTIEGKKPNQGWLGPEMSGEEGATFPEKLWWAIDEAKARLQCEDKDNGNFPGKLGSLYDFEIMDVDENNCIQLVMFASMAKEGKDILPGHVWVDRSFLEIQNMKYLCPLTLGNLLNETNGMLSKFMALNSMAGEGMSPEQVVQNRKEKDELKVQITTLAQSQTPLKWVNRVIMWVADKFPSFADKIPGCDTDDVMEVVTKAMAANTEVNKAKVDRAALIAKYKK